MEIKSEIEVSIVEHINSSNVDGAIDNKEVCKVEEDEIEELKFESNCNFEDKNEGEMDPDDNENQCEENLGIPGGEKHSNEDTFGVEDFKNEIKVEEIDTSDPKYKATRKRSMGHTVWHTFWRNRSKKLTSMTIDIMVGVLDDPLVLSSR